ncbi:PAS domain S-box protein [Dissulfurirhabdus thermomarina]|uniref:histidine kinase n=2 Tax=Dissulfurirhabdus thermomarina TaxID=1765737 RepID=A0A6N9TWN7_DISTH|nr:ATP-binding protein [Dissulfurirhabdus thermomarina]NDY42896.1 PAS domain S-box protein [Dissulfurirhabdus thermomarina]
MAACLALLLAFLAAVDAALLVHRHRLLIAEARRDAAREVALMGTATREALLRSDTENAARLLERWALEHDDIAALSAVAPDGFVLARVQKPLPPDRPTLRLDHEVRDGDRTLVRLEMQRDLAGLRAELSRFALHLGLRSLLVAALFAGMLWLVLRVTAMGPLEAEITRRQQAERRFRDLIDRAPDAMALVDRRGRLAYVNARMEMLFGYTREELLGADVERLIPERYRNGHRRRVRAFLEAPAHVPMEAGIKTVGLTKDGREFPVDISLNPVETEEGTRVLIDVRDVTERRAAEAALERAYRYQRVVSDILAHSLRPASLASQLDYALERILTLPAMAEEGRAAVFLAESPTGPLVLKAQRGLPAEAAARCAEIPLDRCLCGRAAAEDRVVFGECPGDQAVGPCPGLAPHGHYCLPIRCGGTAVGVLTVTLPAGHCRDPREEAFLRSVADALAGIVEHHRVEREKAELRDRLARSEKLSALGRLAFNVAHEIRNPVTALGGLARRLHRAFPDATREKDYTRVILEEASRLEALIEALAVYTRTTPLEKAPLDLNALARESLEEFGPALSDQGIEVTTDFGRLPPAELDGPQIRNALDHLVRNALEAMPGGGRLTVATRPCDIGGQPGVEIRMADTGAGIPPDHLERIFEPFFSGAGRQGTGLGLSICRKIVEDHGGRVEVENAPGEGTAFVLRLPLAAAAAGEAAR